MHVAGGKWVRAHKRRHTGEASIEQTAKRIDISAPVQGETFALLWAHIQRTAETTLLPGGILTALYQAKIQKFDPGASAAKIYHDIGRLDVPVHKAPTVGITQPPAKTVHKIQSLLNRKRSVQ